MICRFCIQKERLLRLLPIYFNNARQGQSIVMPIRKLELCVLDGRLLVEVLPVKWVTGPVTFTRTLVPSVVPVAFGLCFAGLLRQGPTTFESLIEGATG